MAIEPANPQAARRPVDYEALLRIGRDLLTALGENPDREGLAETPRRWASWWQDFLDYDPGTISTAFSAQRTDQLVVISGLKVWSLCEHHLLPFWCEVTIGYIPDGKVLGLSKFGRIAQMVAHRLQLQEQLTAQIADEVQRLTGSGSVVVLGRGEHLCMTMRGIAMPHTMSTSVLRGIFRTDEKARNEFLLLANGR